MSQFQNHPQRIGCTCYTGQEFYRLVCKYRTEWEEASPVRSPIPQRESFTRRTRDVERTIEKLLATGHYTEDNMLVIQDPFRLAPLTAYILFTTSEPCQVSVRLGDGSLYSHTTESAVTHRIPVLCLRSGRENEVNLELKKGSEVILEKQVAIQTPKLPARYVDAVKIKKKAAASYFPLIFVYGGDTPYPYAFDEEGEVRYYLKLRPKAYGLYPMSQGRFLFLRDNVAAPSYSNPHSIHALEMDFFGRVHREYIIPDGIHHDGGEVTPGGDLMTVSSSLLEHVEDAIIRVDRESGKVVDKLLLQDVLPDNKYLNQYLDWAHINTISYQEDEGTILICARNLHSVMKIRWQTRELLWILSDLTIWKDTPFENKVLKPVGDDMGFFYQAHSSYFLSEPTADGALQMIIYDNHYDKRRPVDSFDGDKRSFVRIYEIDEKEMTVRLQQSYPNVKSRIRSIGILEKDHVFSMSGCLNAPLDDRNGTIQEFDRESAELLNEYRTKFSFYRGYRFFPDYDELGRGIDVAVRIRGDVPQAVSVPDPGWAKIEKTPLTPGLRKILRRLAKKDQNLRMVDLSFYEDTLMVTGKDHSIEKIYFKGKDGFYERDYSQTDQRNEIFSDQRYALVCATDNLPAGKYHIYLQWEGRIIDTWKTFTRG